MVRTGGMYTDHFGIEENPFSITPDPRYLYMSKGHQEALAHLLYGVSESGGFVLLTGEVGTGKTSICRCLLEQLPETAEVALILNPRLSEFELLATICDELGVGYPADCTSLKVLVDHLNRYLLDLHAKGRHGVLIIDEAQNLSFEVLEQVRLLTNLETATRKLLQIVLVGQPELTEILKRREMRQVVQRITARYHLQPLDGAETRAYVRHRLVVGGLPAETFSSAAAAAVYRRSRGIPRLINSLCDRCLLGAYTQNIKTIDRRIVRHAAVEVLGRGRPAWRRAAILLPSFGLGAVAAAALLLAVAGPARLGLGAWPAHWDEAGTGPGLETTAMAAGSGAAQADADAVHPAPPPGPAKAAAEQGELPAETPQPVVAEAAPTAQPPDEASLEEEISDLPVIAERTDWPDESMADWARFEAKGQLLLPQAAPPALMDTESVGALLAEVGSAADHAAAMATLYELWGLDAPGEEHASACREAAGPEGLSCFEDKGSWRALADINHPAVITLTAPKGRALYGVVAALDDGLIGLEIGGRRISVGPEAFARHWTGDYMVLWNRPPLKSRYLKLGSSGEDVVWLRRRLAEIEGTAGDGGQSASFDAELKQKVMAFQRSRGLQPDGIVGARTLIHLTGVALGSATPALQIAAP